MTDAKNQFSALIDWVRAGESVLILDRGIPVARLESVIALDEEAEGRLARLQRAGTVRAASQKTPRELISRDPPEPLGGGSAVEALLDERRAGR
ncbi:MAG: type II toxin-antitoxin system Phd/YefM family antitoxin [Pseudonocardiaceae bacterium]